MLAVILFQIFFFFFFFFCTDKQVLKPAEFQEVKNSLPDISARSILLKVVGSKDTLWSIGEITEECWL